MDKTMTDREMDIYALREMIYLLWEDANKVNPTDAMVFVNRANVVLNRLIAREDHNA